MQVIEQRIGFSVIREVHANRLRSEQRLSVFDQDRTDFKWN
jgi:hypothetical protein